MSAQVDLLLEHDTWGERAWTESLLAAAKGRHAAILARLLEKHSYVDTHGFDTALSEAAASGHVEVVKALAENVTDDEAKRPRCLVRGVRSACYHNKVNAGGPCCDTCNDAFTPHAQFDEFLPFGIVCGRSGRDPEAPHGSGRRHHSRGLLSGPLFP